MLEAEYSESKKILLQAGSYGHEGLLDLTKGAHASYCDRHDYGLCADGLRPDPERAPSWQKVRLILDALRNGYETIVWLDADCLIVRPEIDLSEALAPTPTMPLGMVWFAAPYATPAHWNTGAIYLRAGNDDERRELIALFEDAWAAWPVHHPWEDQIGIMKALCGRTHIACQNLLWKWNCTPNLPCDTPVVRAWPGYPLQERITLMSAAVAGLPGA